MRCKKCGKMLPLLTKYCQKCGQQVDPEQKRKAWNHYTIFWAIVLLVAPLVIYIMHRNPAPNVKESGLSIVITAALGTLSGFAAILLPIILVVKLYKGFIALIKVCFKKPIFIPIPLVIISIILGGSYLVSDRVSDFTYGIFYTEARQNAVPLIKDSLTEVAAVKIIGDMLDAGIKSDYSWQNIENTVTNLAEINANIPVRSAFADYKKAATIWPGRIREQIKDTKNWKNLSSLPADFAISLSSSKTKKYLEETVEKLSLLKEFGDDAIKRKDKEAMRYIDAKLLVEEHWLDGVIYSQSNYFVQLVAPTHAYSGEARKICYQANEKDICAGNIKNILVDLEKVANNYVRGKDKAEEEWNNAWSKATKEGGLPQEASSSQKQAKYSPTVQTFVDDCYAKGGSLTGANKNTDRLPTAESGYDCGYKINDLNCWDFLTYSGGKYSGGDDKCPQKNLLPKDAVYKKEQPKAKTPAVQPQAKTPAPAKPKATVQDWDGDYHITGTLACAGNIPDLSSIPIDTVIGVKNNTINNALIDGQGKVSFNVNQTQTFEGVPVTMTGKTNYQFSKNGNILKASGNSSVVMSVTVKEQTFTDTCKGNVTGTKQ
jgi:predicted nucleic acid-binding Zn ribbon protein